MAGSALVVIAAGGEAGDAAAIAAAARIPIIYHLPKGRPAPGKAIRKDSCGWLMRCLSASQPWRENPRSSLPSRIRPPSPIQCDYGQQQLNKSLVNSAKGELFSTDGGERPLPRRQRLLLDAADPITVAFEESDD